MWENLNCKVVEKLSGIYIYNPYKELMIIFRDRYYTTECAFDITKEIHRAIIKQLKELGWNNE